MRIELVNPATGEAAGGYETSCREDVRAIARQAREAYTEWRDVDVTERAGLFFRLAAVLRDSLETNARHITTEMGKPIAQSRAEIEKCAWLAEIYAEYGPDWLAEETVDAGGIENRVVFEPLGVILSIMPWNFPFWQALRFGVPAVLAGNASLLKHARNVPQCALAIERAFREAGFPPNIFRAIFTDHKTVSGLFEGEWIQGVSLTGSTEAGARIAETAGRALKKVVLELGGSDAFIVLDDADVEFAARQAVAGRMINTGQSCIAAKRFIVAEPLVEAFTERFAAGMEALVVGDPQEESTEVGPLVDEDAVAQLTRQMEQSVSMGARVVTGGQRLERPGFYFAPTVVANANAQMPVVLEEVFGPIAPVIAARDDDDAVRIANASPFGLGASVWTPDLRRGERLLRRLEAGTTFVNSVVKSDPRMPFGGVKQSGFGRELSHFGLREFVNVKGISIHAHGEQHVPATRAARKRAATGTGKRAVPPATKAPAKRASKAPTKRTTTSIAKRSSKGKPSPTRTPAKRTVGKKAPSKKTRSQRGGRGAGVSRARK